MLAHQARRSMSQALLQQCITFGKVPSCSHAFSYRLTEPLGSLAAVMLPTVEAACLFTERKWVFLSMHIFNLAHHSMHP